MSSSSSQTGSAAFLVEDADSSTISVQTFTTTRPQISPVDPERHTSNPRTDVSTRPSVESEKSSASPPEQSEPHMSTRSSLRAASTHINEESCEPGPALPKIRFKGPSPRISEACKECRRRKVKCCGRLPCKNCTSAHRPCAFGGQPIETGPKADESDEPTSPPAAVLSQTKDQKEPIHHYVEDPAKPESAPGSLFSPCPDTAATLNGSTSEYLHPDTECTIEIPEDDPLAKELKQARLEVYEAGFQEERCINIKRKLETELEKQWARREDEKRRRREIEDRNDKEEFKMMSCQVRENWRTSYTPFQKRQAEAMKKLTVCMPNLLTMLSYLLTICHRSCDIKQDCFNCRSV